MGSVDFKFWFGLGLTLLSFALTILGAPEGLAYFAFFLGAGLVIVSCVLAFIRSGSAAQVSLAPVRWPDFDKWDQAKEFRLWEPACLWADQEPSMPLTRDAELNFRKFESALREKVLSVRREDLREVIADAYDYHTRGKVNKANPNWVVKRHVLISYAHHIGEKPKFLFPKERT